MDDHARRLVRQHAMTARLMGVDFVPAFRRNGTVDEPAAEHETAPAAARPTIPPVMPSPPRAAMVHPATTPEAPAARPLAAPTTSSAGPKERAASQAALDTLRARYESDAPHSTFVTNFQNIVFGEGDPCARLCFVGEAPGEDEDLSGRPFVGRAGQLLDKMIVAMGLRREDVYICNVLKTRPPGNRTPTQDEVASCKPYLLEQLAIVRPDAVVTLGLSATHALLDSGETMARLRSRWWTMQDSRGRSVPVMPTYHPSFILRSYTPENRAKVWEDLKLALEFLGLPVPARGG